MRRVLFAAVFAFVIVAMLAPPVLAQAPAPKVTITGLFDQITSGGRNFYDGNYSRDGDREWYARTRFRPDIEFAVGRTKAVLGLEIDIMYGQAGANDSGFPGNNSGNGGGNGSIGGGPAGTKFGENGSFDINTDVGGMIEIKWMYTEFDLTGKDSILPFIPVLTVARAGGQPFGTIANYKQSAYASGDFPGVDLYTTITPDIKNHLALVIAETELAGYNRGIPNQRFTRGQDYAFIVSPEVTPFKGLDLKPMFSWFHADGVTNRSSRNNTTNFMTVGGAMNGAGAYCNTNTLAPTVTGFAPATTNAAGALVSTPGACANAGDPTYHENRYTVGLDTRWRLGPFGLDPTVYYQWGSYTTQALSTNGSGIGRADGDASAWLFDVIGSYQVGPLLVELRGTYSTGNKAHDNLSLSKRYFEPIDTDSGWYTGWGAILAGGIDYFNGGGGPSNSMATNIGYDRYGTARAAARVTYNVTPALAVYFVVTPTFSAEKVDTNSTVVLAAQQTYTNRTTPAGAPAQTGFLKGDSRYIGTELNVGTTWRFAPNTALDLQGAYLSAGSALNTGEFLNGSLVQRDANDAYTLAARVRLAF